MSGRGAEINKRVIEDDKLLCGALLGINVVAVVELVGVNQLDAALKVAVHCFAVSIPLLVLHILARINESQNKYHTESGGYFYLVTFFSPFISLAGIGAFFWHFSPTVGLLFIVTGVFALVAFFGYTTELEKANQNNAEESRSSDLKGDA